LAGKNFAKFIKIIPNWTYNKDKVIYANVICFYIKIANAKFIKTLIANYAILFLTDISCFFKKCGFSKKCIFIINSLYEMLDISNA
jgi:hypothetical protein